MRIAKTDEPNPALSRCIEILPPALQFRPTDAHPTRRSLAGRLWRHAAHMKHRCGGCRGECGRERLELIGTGPACLKARYQRYFASRQGTAAISKQGPIGIIGAVRPLNYNLKGGAASGIEVAARQRSSSGESDAHIEKVRILHGPRADDAVRIDDRIRLSPANLLTEPGCAVEQIGSAGKARPSPHG